MAIDRLSSTAALIAALRSDATRKGNANESVQSPTAKTSDRSSVPSRPSITQLRRELVDIVKDVALDDAQAVSQARPRMVRAILLWEFGPGLRDHPEWRPMMDNIVRTLEADPVQQNQFVALISELKTHK